ncbi:uncharacterized protein LOC133385732 [Rhineura floridana]|uniref:uncharacterized protein LOC133385732 n=1 Tax=Rhineura floridana TaxID=261503 RepID=UPI002AC87CA7|nr:uncharacterized protein LOC133385732 [Rhineura floridana]
MGKKKKNKHVKLNIHGKGGLKEADPTQGQKGLESGKASSQMDPIHSEYPGKDPYLEKSSCDAFVRKIKAGKKYSKSKSEQAITVSALKFDTKQTSTEKFKVAKRKKVDQINSCSHQELPFSFAGGDMTEKQCVDHWGGNAKAKVVKSDKYGKIYVQDKESNEEQREFKHNEKFMKQTAVTGSSSSSGETNNDSAKYVLPINQYNYGNMTKRQMDVENRNINWEKGQDVHKEKERFENINIQGRNEENEIVDDRSDKVAQLEEENFGSEQGNEECGVVVEQAENEEGKQDKNVGSEVESEEEEGENETKTIKKMSQ